MVIHYLKIFLRNFRKHKLYTLSGFFSLVFGISFCLIIFLIIKLGMKDPRFHAKYDSLYTVTMQDTENRSHSNFPRKLTDYIDRNLHAVEAVTTYDETEVSFNLEGKTFTERVVFTNPDFFDLFSFDLQKGNAESLNNNNSLLISESMAETMFGGTAVLGKTITAKYGTILREFHISGIIRDYPYNSRIKPDLIASIGFIDDYFDCEDSDAYQCSSKVIIHATADNLSQISDDLNQHMGTLNSLLGKQGENRYTEAQLSPVFDVPSWNNPFVYAIGLLAFIILFLACINYINNTVAVATTRIKEIGIRKVFGVKGSGISTQFLFEALFTAVLAFIASLLLLEMVTPYINQYFISLFMGNIEFTLKPLGDTAALPALFFLVILTGVLAGAYPSFYVSGFDTSDILNNKTRMGGTSTFAKFLVGFQLVISMILMVLILNIYQTVRNAESTTYGVETESVYRHTMVGLSADQPDSSAKSLYPAFETRLQVQNLPVEMGGYRGGLLYKQQKLFRYEGEDYLAHQYQVDPSFFKVLEMQFRSRSPVLNQPVRFDSMYAVINTVLAEQMDVQNPVDHLITFEGRDLRVVGVVEHFTGLESEKQRSPVVFQLIPPDKVSQAVFKIGGEQPGRILNNELAGIWSEVSSSGDFFLPRSFYDPLEDFNMMLKAGGSITLFALLFAFIGLFSLTNFSVTKRLKEISIRKVNGAMPVQIVGLLLSSYVRIGIISVLIALPAGYLASGMLLETYIEKTGNFPVLFITSVFSLIIFIGISVAYQVYQASNVNPVKYLSDE